MKPKKIYLCGPIDSRCVADKTEAEKHDAFKMWELFWTQQGWEVINPYDYGQKWLNEHNIDKSSPDYGKAVAQIMLEEVQMLKDPELKAVFFIRGWEFSTGCKTEFLAVTRRHLSDCGNLYPSPKIDCYFDQDTSREMIARGLLLKWKEVERERECE